MIDRARTRFTLALIVIGLLLGCGAWAAESRLGWEWNERGIILTPQQIRDIETFKRASDQIAEDFRRADEAEDALRNGGNTPLANKLKTLKRKLAEIKTSMPTYAVSRTFAQDLDDYKEQRLRKHNQMLREIRQDIASVRQELGLAGDDGAGAEDGGGGSGAGDGPGTAAGAGASGTTPGAGGRSAGIDLSGFGFYVLEKSGDVAFFVNGKEIEHPHQWVSADGKARGDLRALLVGKQRKRSREFTPTPSTKSFTNDDYQLKYTVASGNFNATTDWRVTEERYDWNVQSSNVGGNHQVFDSGVQPAVKDDAVNLQWDRALTFTISVNGTAKWTPTASGNRRLQPTIDRGTGRIKIAIGPR